MSKIVIHYDASPTITRFHWSPAFYRFIMGPVGSGKSTGCSAELMRRAAEQSPGPDGIRHSRFAATRSTYRELLDTTVKTWLSWWPEKAFGPFIQNTMSQTIRHGDVEAEILFRALETPDDVKKLLSLELTGAYINEVRETPKSIVDALGDRVGRYPAIKDGGCTWRGVIGDTNMPDQDHWLYVLAERDTSTAYGRELLDITNQAEQLLQAKGLLEPGQHMWQFFKQPGGLIERGGKFEENPDAENIDHLEPHYYLTRISGKGMDHIRVYYCSQYGFVKEGKPVIPEYVDALHCSPTIIPAVVGIPLYVGLDFGLTPAAVFGQRLPNGRMVWIDELVTEDMGAVRFGELLKQRLQADYKNFIAMRNGIRIAGDPAGEQRAQTDETTPFKIINKILESIGIKAHAASTNDFSLRREAIAVPLSKIIDGKPGLMVSPKCAITRKGLAGGYCYKRIKVSGDERFHDMPDKNRFSHPVEAGGYLMIEAGEGQAIVAPRSKPERKTVAEIMRRYRR